MSQWISVAQASQCPPGTGREVLAGNHVVALFNVNGQFFALDGICPHQGGPLAQGQLVGCIVTCPWHGWQYDVRTGQHQSIRALVHRHFPVKVEGDEILIEVDA